MDRGRAPNGIGHLMILLDRALQFQNRNLCKITKQLRNWEVSYVQKRYLNLKAVSVGYPIFKYPWLPNGKDMAL